MSLSANNGSLWRTGFHCAGLVQGRDGSRSFDTLAHQSVPFQNIVFEHDYRSFVLGEDSNETVRLVQSNGSRRHRHDHVVW
jgi:hypothetical protein